MSTKFIDRRADIAAILTNPIRRRIRDLLRDKGELSLSEIARELNQSEPNTYYHLNTMLKSGIVEKRNAEVSGRRVTLYSLSKYYDEAFPAEGKPDFVPIYVLFIVYSFLLVLYIVNAEFARLLFSYLGLANYTEASIVTGFTISLVLLVYYVIRYELFRT